MKKSDLIWAICDIDEDLLRLTEEESAMPKKHTRPLRVFLIAAAVAALLAGTVLAYAIRHWDELFVSAFQVEDSDKELLDGSLQDVYAQTTQDGVTCTITQLLGSEHCLVVALDIQLPEDLEVSTTFAEELNTRAEELDLPTGADEPGSPFWQLSKYFGYDPNRTDFPDAPYTEDISIFPVTMEKDELLTEIEKRRAAMVRNGDADSIPVDRLTANLSSQILYDRSKEELGEDYNVFGWGAIKRSYDPDAKTLRCLCYTQSTGSLVNQPYTLVIDHLYLENLADFFSPDNLLGDAGVDLLTSPLVLNFTANFTPQSQVYDLLQDGTPIGTMELSPVSAHLTIPLEPDDTVYSSLEQAALAPNRQDYLKGNPQPIVRMHDGREIQLQMNSGGIGNEQTAFYIADDIIDLSQVEELLLEGFTPRPQSAK